MKYILFFLITNYSILGCCQNIKFPDSSEAWKVFAESQKPTFKIMTNKSQYEKGEPVVVRFILTNDTSEKIPVFEKSLQNASHSVTAGIYAEKDLTGYSKKRYSISGCSQGFVADMHYDLLEPGETLIADYIIGLVAPEQNNYYVHAQYYWRPCNPRLDSTKSFSCKHLKAPLIEISVNEPTDEEAIKFMPNELFLSILQTPYYYCTPACAEDESCQDTEEYYMKEAKKFLERFPESVYARYMNYTLGIMLRKQGRFEEAEEQMNKFINLYKDDWMVDDAMFEKAESQIEQGKLDEAKSTLEMLLDRFPLTSAYNARRVYENLRKDFRTLEEIYSH